MNIHQTIAQELSVKPSQVDAAIKLLDEGATVPFISRYRKEATDGLTDTQLRDLAERLQYLRELEERRAAILKSIEEQGKLTAELQQTILAADSKSRLEDLYLPYKPKRRTKAQIAREAGLEPLATSLWQNPNLIPEKEAEKYIDAEKKIADVASALDGAGQILMELFSEHADLLEQLRNYFWQHGILTSKVAKEKEGEGIKFSDYFDFNEPIKKIPSHRALALFRGRNENVLQLSLVFAETDNNDNHGEEYCINLITSTFNLVNRHRPADQWLLKIAANVWQIKLSIKIEVELMSKLREAAEEEAIKVFASNLKNLLMASPAGNKITLGLDPGLRTGVKVTVVDSVGKLLEYTTIFPHVPRNEWSVSLNVLAKLCSKYQVELISIGNGTASRETERLVSELIKVHTDLKLTKAIVSEAGASVYSASKLAAEEFPDLDVSYRGAVSIARRLQDPLAELVKIDPKAIGVGQYQHDVNQILLGKSLAGIMEDCVNAVGADVNMASVQLLSSISGLNENVAKNIVVYRETNGRFNTREEIKKVPRLGEKSYEQAIGFLRIIGGKNPLDASAVHPEAYPIVEKILQTLENKPINEVMGNNAALSAINPQSYVDERFGLPTVKDIISELNKPGRDPRPEFKTATFKDGVEKIGDLLEGMVLEGTVTNVTNFGAFVDIGVHQDGLVHISEMANQYVQDPHAILKVGQVVKVKVMAVDIPRKRIGLSMRLDKLPDKTNRNNQKEATENDGHKTKTDKVNKANSKLANKKDDKPKFESALACALADAFNKTN